jgi:hypothetical protein
VLTRSYSLAHVPGTTEEQLLQRLLPSAFQSSRCCWIESIGTRSLGSNS